MYNRVISEYTTNTRMHASQANFARGRHKPRQSFHLVTELVWNKGMYLMVFDMMLHNIAMLDSILWFVLFCRVTIMIYNRMGTLEKRKLALEREC